MGQPKYHKYHDLLHSPGVLHLQHLHILLHRRTPDRAGTKYSIVTLDNEFFYGLLNLVQKSWRSSLLRRLAPVTEKKVTGFDHDHNDCEQLSGKNNGW